MGILLSKRVPLSLTTLRHTKHVPLRFDVLSENRKSGRRAASFFSHNAVSGRGVEGSQLGGGTHGPSPFQTSSPFPDQPSSHQARAALF